VLRRLPGSEDPNVLVGFGTSDDAGVYRLSDDLAIVQTVDFFTPIVDDPFDFGRIAATNALSDIYAMGALPLTALNIAAFPIAAHGLEPLAQIFAGGADVARTAGVAILGGHTIEDDEPKYGMAVTGRVHPQRIVTNAGAQPGDVIFLTKPLGTGILGSALKSGALDAQALHEAVRWMTVLNAGAAQAMQEVGVHAATDVTGFGLLGHAHEIARASGVRLRIDAARVPLLTRARELVAAGILPGGSRRNAAEHAGFTTFSAAVDADMRRIFSDAQTSGGLLICVAADRAGALRAALLERNALPAMIGSVETGAGLTVEDSRS
jgi:selenide,water dikinase